MRYYYMKKKSNATIIKLNLEISLEITFNIFN